MSIFGRKRKDESNLKDLIDALNNINNAMEKSSRYQESKKDGNEDDKNPKLNIFGMVKEYWFIVSLLTFVYALYIYIVIYYRVFDYNLPITIEYIQEQIANGFYKWILYSILIAGMQTVSYIPPLMAIGKFIKRWGTNKRRKNIALIMSTIIWVLYCLLMENTSVFYLTTIIILGPKKTRQKIGDGFEVFIYAYGYYIFWIIITTVTIAYCTLRRKSGSQINYSSNLFKICIMVIPFLLFVSFPMWSPMYRPGFLNGGSSVYCISGNNGEKPVDAIPYKYEARGVYVFRGEIKTNNEGNKYLSNVNREFLFFEKGYKVTSGVCRQSSPSFKQPPQYSRPPQ
jgi:putative NADH-ubiquinone oxidoreductase chain 2